MVADSQGGQHQGGVSVQLCNHLTSGCGTSRWFSRCSDTAAIEGSSDGLWAIRPQPSMTHTGSRAAEYAAMLE